MKLPITFILVAAFAVVVPLPAHEDASLFLKGDTVVGLPTERFGEASFSFAKRKLTVGERSVVIPSCIWKHFGDVKKDELRFAASWYHDSHLPPYLSISVPKRDSRGHFQLLINLETLQLIWFKRVILNSAAAQTHDDVPIEDACRSSWAVARRK